MSDYSEAEDRRCSLDGCSRPHNARGLCNAHYMRVLRGSEAEGPIREYDSDHEPTECEGPDCSKKKKYARFCRSCYNTRRQQQIRLMVLASMGAECMICGADDLAVSSYSYHHKDPETKTKQVGDYICDKNLDKALEEASKCLLLCSNCHRAHHNPQTGRVIHHG